MGVFPDAPTSGAAVPSCSASPAEELIMANPLTNFTLTAQSRHPKNNRGYDSATHAYRAGFVRRAALARHVFPKGPLVSPTPDVPDDDIVIGAEA
jgi:hypothetical protein